MVILKLPVNQLLTIQPNTWSPSLQSPQGPPGEEVLASKEGLQRQSTIEDTSHNETMEYRQEQGADVPSSMG